MSTKRISVVILVSLFILGSVGYTIAQIDWLPPEIQNQSHPSATDYTIKIDPSTTPATYYAVTLNGGVCWPSTDAGEVCNNIPADSAVSFTSGTFVFNQSWTPESNTVISGQNDLTVLKNIDGNALNAVITIDSVNDVVVKNLKIDGNLQNNVFWGSLDLLRDSGNGVLISNSSNITIDNVHTVNTGHHGLYVWINSSGNCVDITWRNCLAESSGEDGYRTADNVRNLEIIDCTAKNNNVSGAFIAATIGGLIQGCNFNNNTGDGLRLGGNYHLKVLDNVIELNGMNGIAQVTPSTTYNTIKGNEIHGNGWLNNNTYSAIVLYGATYTDVSNNNLEAYAYNGATDVRYSHLAIVETGQSNYNSIIDNTNCRNYYNTSTFSLTGSYTKVYGNSFYNPIGRVTNYLASGSNLIIDRGVYSSSNFANDTTYTNSQSPVQICLTLNPNTYLKVYVNGASVMQSNSSDLEALAFTLQSGENVKFQWSSKPVITILKE